MSRRLLGLPLKKLCDRWPSQWGNKSKFAYYFTDHDLFARSNQFYCRHYQISVSRYSSETSGLNESVKQPLFEDPRTAILNAALVHVPSKGWSAAALSMGAKDCGFSSIAVGMFPRGSSELIDFFMQRASLSMKKDCEDYGEQFHELSFEQRVSFAIKSRLRALVPFVSTWPNAMAEGLALSNLSYTAKTLKSLSEEIFALGGIDANDMSPSTQIRRALIGSIYVSSELFFINDASSDYEETWKFVDRCLEDFKLIGTAPETVQDVTFGVSTIAFSLASAVESLAIPVVKQLPGISAIVPVLSSAAETANHLVASTLKIPSLVDMVYPMKASESEDLVQDTFPGAIEEDPFEQDTIENVEKELGLSVDEYEKAKQ